MRRIWWLGALAVVVAALSAYHWRSDIAGFVTAQLAQRSLQASAAAPPGAPQAPAQSAAAGRPAAGRGGPGQAGGGGHAGSAPGRGPARPLLAVQATVA